jgi:hypothetical protein
MSSIPALVYVYSILLCVIQFVNDLQTVSLWLIFPIKLITTYDNWTTHNYMILLSNDF